MSIVITKEMERAGCLALDHDKDDIPSAYRAMRALDPQVIELMAQLQDYGTPMLTERKMRVTQIRPPLYEAKHFRAETKFGEFSASGTLCGHIDFVGPFKGCYPLSTDEALALIKMLKNARSDVLDHSNPLHDPRII